MWFEITTITVFTLAVTCTGEWIAQRMKLREVLAWGTGYRPLFTGQTDFTNPFVPGTPCASCPSKCENNLCGEQRIFWIVIIGLYLDKDYILT